MLLNFPRRMPDSYCPVCNRIPHYSFSFDVMEEGETMFMIRLSCDCVKSEFTFFSSELGKSDPDEFASKVEDKLKEEWDKGVKRYKDEHIMTVDLSKDGIEVRATSTFDPSSIISSIPPEDIISLTTEEVDPEKFSRDEIMMIERRYIVEKYYEGIDFPETPPDYDEYHLYLDKSCMKYYEWSKTTYKWVTRAYLMNQIKIMKEIEKRYKLLIYNTFSEASLACSIKTRINREDLSKTVVLVRNKDKYYLTAPDS